MNSAPRRSYPTRASGPAAVPVRDAADPADSGLVMAPPDQMLTLPEVADILRIPVATLRYWRHVGTGPDSFKIGRHVRYFRGAVNAWIRDQLPTGGNGAA